MLELRTVVRRAIRFSIARLMLLTLFVGCITAIYLILRPNHNSKPTATFPRAKSQGVFAISGLIDFDRDGRTDVDKLRRVIEENGGVVSSYQKIDGNVVGIVDIETDYLIVDKSTGLTGNPTVATAKNAGVIVLDVNQFLGLVESRKTK